jgi:hypothetical protein
MRALIRTMLFCFFCAQFSFNCLAQFGIIATVAGNGTRGSDGDGGQATLAQLNGPYDVAVDSEGNLYIADTANVRIRKVTLAGVISTVAGNGTQGYSGDGGPATSAQINAAYGVAVDSEGNLFISDYDSGRVRKVTPAGVISTVAGNGTRGSGGDGGQATLAQLNQPCGVAVDSEGNLYIADTSNNRIRKVTSGGVISTVAGNGTQGYNGDGGQATLAQLFYPYGVAVDSAGNLYIADMGNSCIRKVTPAGVISTVAGNRTRGSGGDGGQATLAQLSMPTCVAVDSEGNLYIAATANDRIRKVTSSGVISTVAGNGTPGYSGDGGPATLAQLYYLHGVAVDFAGNLYIADTGNKRIRKATALVTTSLNLTPGGAANHKTAGVNGSTRVGYAKLSVGSGMTPYGTAVFSFKQNGVTVGEAGVPASPPITQARIFIDYRTAVQAVPAHSERGNVNVNTGIAVVNNGSASASVTYTLRDASGGLITTGHGTIGAGKHIACFIDQFKQNGVPDFNLPSDFATAIQFGSLEITSTQPLSVLALRGTMNQRNEFLITTTPVADLTQALGNGSVYFPQFVDGGGYTTSLMLLNTSSVRETGKLEIRDKDGNMLAVTQVGGTNDSSFSYSIEPGGLFRFQTDGFPFDTKAGWVVLTPDSGTPTPVGSGVFGYNPDRVLVSESGIPAAAATMHARVYVDLSNNHNTGLALANVSNGSSAITIRAFQKDGTTTAGTGKPPIPLLANGHKAAFADEFVTGLPAGFTGVLDISSTAPFAALTLRSLMNERNEFLMTAFPVADANQPAPSPMVFPQIADGGGYVTEIILISAGQSTSTTVTFYDENGTPADFGK